jgi:hypothetical protein
MDATYWADDLTTDPRTTEVTVQFDGQEHTVVASKLDVSLLPQRTSPRALDLHTPWGR